MQYHTIVYIFAAMLAGTAAAGSVNAEAPNAATNVEARQPGPGMSAGKAESIARLRTRAVLQARAQTCGQPCAVLGKQCEDDGLFETRCHSCKDATFITSKSTGDTTVYSGNICMQPDGTLYHS